MEDAADMEELRREVPAPVQIGGGDGDFLREGPPDLDIRLAPVDTPEAATRNPSEYRLLSVESAVPVRADKFGGGDNPRENAGGIIGSE